MSRLRRYKAEFSRKAQSKAIAQPARSEGQMSGVSSGDESSQPTGFFGQASKLVSSMLGVNKKDKGPVKSIQLAAAAAKKVSIVCLHEHIAYT